MANCQNGPSRRGVFRPGGLSSNWTENRVKPERYGGRARCGSTRSKLFAFDRYQIIQAALNLSHTAGTDQCCEVGVVLKHFLHFRHLPEGVPDKEEPAVEASRSEEHT